MLSLDRSTWEPRALAVLRIMTALVFLQHGLQKLISFPIGPVPGYHHASLAGVAGVMEVVATPFLLIGLFTRQWSFVMSGLMAVAYFLGHADKGFFPLANGGDVAVLLCFIFLYMTAAGGGAWTVDAHRVDKAAADRHTGAMAGRTQSSSAQSSSAQY